LFGGQALARKTSDRLLELLELFATDKPYWTVEAAAEKLGIATSSAYRYFASLASGSYIVRIGGGRYVLGPAIIRLDRQMRRSDPLITLARSEMRKIASAAPPYSVVLLCRLYQNQVICVHEELIHRPELSSSYERGLPMPLWRGASSKAVLAHLPARIARNIWKKHTEEMTACGFGPDWQDVKAQLRALRSQGVTVTVSELGTPTKGVAAPIFNEGLVIGSLSLVLLIDQIGVDDPSNIELVRAAAIRTSRALDALNPVS
jgi:DNA-binding IclR family transcriptional regulator